MIFILLLLLEFFYFIFIWPSVLAHLLFDFLYILIGYLFLSHLFWIRFFYNSIYFLWPDFTTNGDIWKWQPGPLRTPDIVVNSSFCHFATLCLCICTLMYTCISIVYVFDYCICNWFVYVLDYCLLHIF